jgi:Domain of unknown function (DUF6883)
MSPPRFHDVFVDPSKLCGYCLSDQHPRGRHKARVFRSRLGLTARDAELLQGALVAAVHDRPGNLIPAVNDRYGERFILDFAMTTAAGTATVRSGWILASGQQVLRFLTCYVLD